MRMICPLQEWLEEKNLAPVEAKAAGEDIYWGTKLAILEMIRYQNNDFMDMYFQMDQMGRAVGGEWNKGSFKWRPELKANDGPRKVWGESLELL